MSGHSKWSTIKRKKGANDAKRGQLFAKLVKAIEIAARSGGTDPANNASLYQAIQKAKSNSVPNENIERALKRVDGNLETGEIFELSYDGYAPHGVALLISCLTDNKNRTSSDVKAILTKHGGSMGTPGSVNYLFERKAVFQFDNYNDDLIDLALNSECLDVLESNESVTFEFPPSDFKNMNEIFNNNSFVPSNAEIAQIPNVGVVIDIEKFKSISKLCVFIAQFSPLNLNILIYQILSLQ